MVVYLERGSEGDLFLLLDPHSIKVRRNVFTLGEESLLSCSDVVKTLTVRSKALRDLVSRSNKSGSGLEY